MCVPVAEGLEAGGDDPDRVGQQDVGHPSEGSNAERLDHARCVVAVSLTSSEEKRAEEAVKIEVHALGDSRADQGRGKASVGL